MYFRNIFKQMSNKSNFRGHFDRQHGKVDQTMLKSARQQLYHICWSLWRQLIWKKSFLVICEVLRLFVNISIADDKFFLINRDNFREPIQMQLSQKQRTFSQNFSAILKYRLNVQHFHKKDGPHSWCLFENSTPKNVVK